MEKTEYKTHVGHQGKKSSLCVTHFHKKNLICVYRRKGQNMAEVIFEN